ncbi:DUF3068 domain-containing protein [Geodermatophilus amargosae]|uniref:DUF3068 domain-containing protein n=1 Tax=Geodermatophilus amargosae TaxID=1296565 RepID=UPI0034DE39AD
MRRRVLGFVLLGLGALCLGAALAVRLVLAPTLVTLPLDQKASVTVVDPDATYLDFESLSEVSGEVTARLQVRGDVTAGEASDDVAVWSSGTTITNEDGDLLTEPAEVVNCLDRTTAEAVDCDAASADIDGLTLTFPFDTQQQDYEVWNGNVGEAVTARYDGEDEVEGVEVYRFVQTVPETVIRTAEVPGTFAGESSADTVTADVVYSSERTILVEPVSGKIVSSVEHPVTVLRGPGGDTGLTVLEAELGPTDEGLGDAAAGAAETRDQITLVQRTLPLAIAGLGVVLLLVGAFLLLRAPRGAHRADPAPAVQPTAPVTFAK